MGMFSSKDRRKPLHVVDGRQDFGAVTSTFDSSPLRVTMLV